MITVEECNTTEETKFIMAARLLRSYIHENLIGAKKPHVTLKTRREGLAQV